MHYYGDQFWGLASGFGAVVMVLFWVFLISLIVWAIRSVRGDHHHHGAGQPSALNTLNERYAKGEITKEEYEQKKKDILS